MLIMILIMMMAGTRVGILCSVTTLPLPGPLLCLLSLASLPLPVVKGHVLCEIASAGQRRNPNRHEVSLLPAFQELVTLNTGTDFQGEHVIRPGGNRSMALAPWPGTEGHLHRRKRDSQSVQYCRDVIVPVTQKAAELSVCGAALRRGVMMNHHSEGTAREASAPQHWNHFCSMIGTVLI